jgi:hypothetical protein
MIVLGTQCLPDMELTEGLESVGGMHRQAIAFSACEIFAALCTAPTVQRTGSSFAIG